VPTMKVTLSAAMRARDVSRPHPEHVAAAEQAADDAAAGGAADGGQDRQHGGRQPEHPGRGRRDETPRRRVRRRSAGPDRPAR